MLAFGICLFFLTIPDKEELKNYAFARKVMGVTFLVYCAALICETFSQQSLVGDLLNSMIVIAIGITQAFLFTYSLIALLDISFFTKRAAFNPNRSLENDKKLFLMTAIRKTALYMLDS